MNVLEDTMKQISNEDLKICFLEIVKYKNTGLLPIDSNVRKIRDSYVEDMNYKDFDVSCVFICDEIVFEIARRSMNDK